jgi:4-amino-4-deoxy-L-arabinose transferase-like glycosyltransferase
MAARSTASRRAPGIVIAAGALATTANVLGQLGVQTQPPWDQAHHLTLAAYYARALTEHSFLHQFLSVSERYPPGHHLLLALATLIMGPDPNLGLVVNLFALPLLLFALYRLGQRLFDPTTAALACVIWLLFPGTHVFLREAQAEFWLGAIVTFAMLLVLECDDFARRRTALTAGVVIGFGLWIKPTILSCLALPLCAIAMRVVRSRNRVAIANMVCAGALSAAIAAAWYVPHYRDLVELLVANRVDGLRWGHTGTIAEGLRVVPGLVVDVGTIVTLVAFVASVLLRSRRGGDRNRWLLEQWLGGFFVVLVCATPWRDNKYLLCVLPAMALEIAAWLCNIRARALRYVATTAVAVPLLVVSAHLALDWPRLPPPPQLFAGAPRAVPWQPNLTATSPDSHDWNATALVNVVARRAPAGARVGVIPNLTHLNIHALLWEAVRRGYPLTASFLGAPASAGRARAELEQVDFVVAKTGSQGDAPITVGSACATSWVLADPQRYELIFTVPLPDGSVAQLFEHRRTQPAAQTLN